MRCALGMFSALLLTTVGFAAPADRITGTIDSSHSVVLKGSVHAKAQPQFDQGPVDPAMSLDYITMMIQPSAKQQAALQQLLQQQQDPASPNYHKWLTPEQYADRFGLSQNDVDKLTVWLQSQGFSIVQVARGRNWIAFSGTAALVENTFHTQIHYFNIHGERHFANATDISIPQALAGIVGGFGGLNDFKPKPMGIRNPSAADFFTIMIQPFYTDPTNPTYHFLAPDDIATIYDLNPLYSAGFDGTGTKMVIVGQTDINTTDITNFRSGFNLPTINLEQVLTGSDPGTTSDLGEADLDIEWSSAVARNATIIYVYSKNVFDSAQYAIDQNLAPVISMSYGACEADNASILPSVETVLQQANTEGITFLAASGDTGAAGCDDDTAKVAIGGLAVNYPASSPEVTGVGGNEFNEGSGTYWSTSNDANGASALSYIPEMAWNDTALSISAGYGLSASGGGASSCDKADCASGFAKPSWQTGTGVPKDDGVRDVPDVAMTASPDHDGYIFCSDNSCASGIQSAVQNNSIVGGTSASTPVFAGIVTLLNQFLGGSGLGNINPKLYQLAQNSSNGVFHDVTKGDNIVPCTPGTPSGAPVALQCPKSGTFGYSAGAGYDQVTGLGSVDANALVKNFSGSASATTTTVSSSPSSAQVGASVTFAAAVTTTGSKAPTGTVTFNNGSTPLGTATLSSGSAVFATYSLPAGSNSITATYNGDAFNAPSTSSALTETINSDSTTTTTTTVSPSANPASYGTAVTFTATVKNNGTAAAPTGTVAFNDGSTPLGTGSLNSSTGVATLTTSSLTAGTHNIAAVYNGDSNNAPSSMVLAEAVQGTTTTTVAAGGSSVFSGASISFTATITGSPGVGPTGTVTFKDGPTALGTATLSSGTASFATASLTTPGTHSITAVYSGDSNYSGSTSAAANVTVNAATFSFSASPSTESITSGTAATYTLTLVPSGVYTSQVSFSCAFSPSSSASCSANPVTPGGTQATVTLTISGAQASAAVVNPENRGARRALPLYALWMPMGVAGLFLLGGGKRSRKQSLRVLLLMGALLIMAVSMFGCGGGSSSSTPPAQQAQTYQVTITATAPATASGSSAAVTKTQTVSLTVNP